MIARPLNDFSEYHAVQEKIHGPLNADEDFRQEVTNSMTEFGINPHAIETGLEKNADLWRQSTMEIAFVNKFIRPLWEKRAQTPVIEFHKTLEKVESYRADWLALHEYEYYQNHKKIIDELDLATPNMTIKPAEAILRDINWKYNYKRHTKQIFKKTTPIKTQNTTPTQNTELTREQ